MSKLLFATHEDLEFTPVSKAMFQDVATQLSSKYGLPNRIFSASKKTESNGEFFTFARETSGKFDFSSFFSIIKAYKIFYAALDGVDIVLFRSYPSFIVFSPLVILLGKNIIFDSRGLFFDELVDSGKLNRRWIVLLRWVEKLLLKLSNSVICVTKAQALFYKNTHKIKLEKLIVIPNGAKNVVVKQDMSGAKALSFCYVGSLVRWHLPFLVRDFCSELDRRGISFSLDVITRETEKAKEIFKEVSQLKVFSHNFRESPIRYDYGFCFIGGGVSKQVCYPVKFNEYVVSGTSVIALDTVAEVNRLIRRYKLGVVLNGTSVGQLVEEFLLARNSFSSDVNELPYELSFDYQCECIASLIKTTRGG